MASETDAEFSQRRKDYEDRFTRAQQLPPDDPSKGGKAYKRMITPETAKPLSTFLRNLGNEEHPELLFDFLKSPFITARTAGVPYAAALMLGSGNWNEISAALMAENDQHRTLVAQVTEGLGPVWVKAT